MALLTTIGAFLTAITSHLDALRHPIGPPKLSNFLTELSSFYSYNWKLDAIRRTDMVHLNGSIDLDYTGSDLCRTCQLRSVFDHSEKTLFANPHSLSHASTPPTDLVPQQYDFLDSIMREFQRFDSIPIAFPRSQRDIRSRKSTETDGQ
jgi:hypothetical protein